MCQAFIGANIEWNKLNCPSLVNFLQKCCHRRIPNKSTLRKNYLPKCYNNAIENIRKEIGENNIWITTDETTDRQGRYMATLIVGKMSDEKMSFPMILAVKELERTNNVTVSRFINESLGLLWPSGIRYEKLKLLITDGAPYMIKSGSNLKIFYPNMIHLTCMAHALNLVCEVVRNSYENVNGLISNVKKVFLKAPLRIQVYKEKLPNTPLPPEPVITRWGTWLSAAFFYAENFDNIKDVMNRYFSQGNIDDSNYLSEGINSYYGIVVYQAADCLPHPSSDTIGPFVSPSKLLSAIDKLELIGGKGESHANIAEGLATTLQCFEELQQKRENNGNVQRHCVLVCNSPPYSLPVFETHAYSGKSSEQLAAILQEKNINLSIISPRKIPSLYKLFEKAGGDLTASQTKNYAKDPRHLVLLRGFSLKERPLSPPPGTVTSSQTQIANASSIPITSLPSPLANSDSPISGSQTMSNSTANTGVASGVGPSPVYRPPNQGISMPQHSQNMVTPNMVGLVNPCNNMNSMNPTMNNPMKLPAPPSYPQANRPRWPSMMPPTQPRGYLQPNQQVTTTQSSALIAQLTQPPNSMPGTGVNQFGQMSSNSPMNTQQQQQQLKINIMNQQNQQTNVQTSMAQNPSGAMAQVSQPNQVVTSAAQSTAQPTQSLGPGRERHSIWQGLLEWIEKPKNPTDQQKITKHVPCQVSANSKDGEPELKADGWPSKLIMQLMPKQLIGNIGGAYLKNSKSVLFHPQPCEALDSLTKVMSSGFAGCVHFTSVANPAACDIKVLILLYTAEKRAYLGFIPNDQSAFVDRLRKVIQQQKTTQIMRQTQGAAGQPLNPQTSGALTMSGTPPQMGGTNPVTSQTSQQGLMMSQTNTMAMGGGQITQNVVTSSGQPGILGQNVPGGGMQPRIRMQNMQPNMGPQSTQAAPNQNNMGLGMMGNQGQRAPFENQLQVERQQNLEKINQLKQTLEAAQQQEQQYKSQLEKISHMKTAQLQEALQICQQTEMKYKILDQQRMANQAANQQAAATAQQQQRMMRPVMGGNNPGLRHLLQQQPQYRQQLMNMQQLSGNGPRPQMNQQMSNSGNNPQAGFDEVPYDFM